MLPDPLSHIRTQYDQLVADVQSGALPYNEATEALDNLVAIDGAGQHWSIDLQGDFTCAAAPGETPQVTDPTRFVPAQLPASGPVAPPWATAGGPTAAPAIPGAPGMPPQQPHGPANIPAGVPTGGFDPATGAYQAPPDPVAGPVRHLDDPNNAKEKLSRTIGSNPIAAKAVGLFQSNRRLLIILGIVLAVLVILSVYQRITHDPLDDGGASIPSSDESSDEDSNGFSEDPPPVDGDNGGDQEGDQDGDGQAVPSVEAIDAALSALTSGDRSAVAAVISDPGSDAALALGTANFAGWDTARVAIVPEPPVEAEGGVTQTLKVQDADDGTEYQTATVTWVSTGDGWKFASWPAIQN